MPVARVEATASGLAWYTFTGEPLDMHPGFVHAMFTRLGGVSQGAYASLNLGGTVGDSPAAVHANLGRVAGILDIRETQIVSPRQVHGNRVAPVTPQDGGTVIPDTDALITDQPGVALLLRFADCVPVLFYDPVHRAAGLAHAGWRGVAAEVAPATVSAMVDHFGTAPEALWAGIGPCIGPDHYVVGEEVVTAIQATLPAGVQVAEKDQTTWTIDLASAVKAQLHATGVSRVDLAGMCTACNTEEWYSHRGERGHTGRFGVAVMLR
ncbi:MAG: peptidoglycan editing factor PgeF [Anaerolineae bacterium]|nr:peptidoglycan editing factor PgeF [Anaerolineae bacterium]